MCKNMFTFWNMKKPTPLYNTSTTFVYSKINYYEVHCEKNHAQND